MKSDLAYYEGKVMFSSLCKQHKIFNSTPCKQFTTWSSDTKILFCFGLRTAEVTDVSFLETKQRTLKHIPCGLKMFWNYT